MYYHPFSYTLEDDWVEQRSINKLKVRGTPGLPIMALQEVRSFHLYAESCTITGGFITASVSMVQSSRC
jgi:hypothetical protein